jgi:hypothetical protein
VTAAQELLGSAHVNDRLGIDDERVLAIATNGGRVLVGWTPHRQRHRAE